MTHLRRYGAELLGTLLLVTVETGVGTVDAITGGRLGIVGRYLADGLMVCALIYSLSGISGAHINPAVTFGFLLHRDIRPFDALWYWVAQFAGAALGAGVVLGIFGSQVVNGGTAPQSGFGWSTALEMEFVLSFILVFVILSTSEQKAIVGKNAAIAIGFTVALCGFFGGAVSGASMNPARSFGPALVSGTWHWYWIYVVGPVCGAAVAATAALIHGKVR